jgi:hypothetical protein
LGERQNRTLEVVGSIPIGSTKFYGLEDSEEGQFFIHLLCEELHFLPMFYPFIVFSGRARWGGSGALLPAIRYSGVEFHV